MKELSQKELKSILHYDPATGKFTWKVDKGINAPKGARAGANCNGYVRIKINGKNYLAHRLAFLYMTGEWPKKYVDHENRIRSDNRWCNIRPATMQENNFNRDVKGYHWHQRLKKYLAKITVDGRNIYLGFHTCPKAAHEAYLDAKKKLHIYKSI